jgi:hypothetical protein
LGSLQQLVGRKQVHDPMPVVVSLQQIVDVQCRLAQEVVAAL